MRTCPGLSAVARRAKEGGDSVKVAQPRKLSGLGNDAERHGRPVGDDRNARLLASHAAQRLPAFVDRPVPPSSRRRFAMARPSYCGRAIARSAEAA